MATRFRSLLVLMTLLVSIGGGMVNSTAAASDEDSFDTYGAEPRPLPKDAVEMIVYRVVDGDTLHLTYPDDDWYYPVRIIGIDSPEKSGPYTSEECFGNEASAELARLLPKGTVVFVEQDVTDVDRNDRWLRHVWLPFAEDGRDVEGQAYLVSEILVRGGWADAKQYEPDDKYDDVLIEAEKDAKREDAGFWGAC
jgi:micrococcal nuclease